MAPATTHAVKGPDRIVHRESFVGHGGVKLAADVVGTPGAPEIVLLHGGGQTRHAWRKAMHALAAAGYRVVSLDTRGHGDSDWAADGDYSFDALCGDLQAILPCLHGKPVLVGASMGGCVALALAGEIPDLAAALVLVDVAPRLEEKGVEHVRQFMAARPDGFASLEEVAQVIAAYNPSRQPTDDLQGLKKNLRQGHNGRWYWHWDPAFIAGDQREIVAGISERMRSAAQKIAIPTLLVRGQTSDVVSLQGVDELKQLIPHLEFVDVAQAGHMVAGDRNDVFNAAIIEFLQRHFPSVASA